MASTLANKYLRQHARIKQNIDAYRDYFRPNYEYYHKMRKFLFKSTLEDNDANTLLDLGKPVLEFNILESYVSRLCGEFSKQEPSVAIRPSHDMPIPVDIKTANVVEGNLRHELMTANSNGFSLETYKSTMSGAFDTWKIYTDYAHNRTTNQVIKFKRVFDPTMCGFDPVASLPHKGDGEYCFELFPYTLEKFKSKYPKVDTKKIKFYKDNSGYSWSFTGQKDDKILLVCDYYEKQYRPIKIVRLANNMEMTNEQYNGLLQIYKERQIISVPPKIVESRNSVETYIVRYTIIEDQVIDFEETNYSELPLIFVDGNSAHNMRDNFNASQQQVVRAYHHNGKDAQRLKNFAGQTLANELENMIMHKFKVALESVPDSEMEKYQDIQHADVLFYRAFQDENGTIPLPPPIEVQRTPIPPEVTNTFQLIDGLTQNIFGSFDAALGINNNQLSGIAIQEGATQSNAAAMPYINNYLLSLNQLAKVYVGLLPKYCVTPRTIPIMDTQGKRNYVPVNTPNDPNAVYLDYEENALEVSVTAGVNFAVQKARALQQIIGLMQASPLFAQFMNQKGLPILLDNLEIRGVDELKLLAEEFVKEMQMQMQQQAQMAQQNNPMLLKQQELAMRQQEQQQNFQIEMAKLQQNNVELQSETLDRHQDRLVEAAKIDSENLKTMAQASNATRDLAHKHAAQIAAHHLNVADKLQSHVNDIAQMAQDGAMQQQQINNQQQQQSNQEVQNA